MDIVEVLTWSIVGALTFLALAGAVIGLADYLFTGTRKKEVEIYEPLDGSWRKIKRS